METGQKQSRQLAGRKMLDRRSNQKRGYNTGQHGIFDRNPHQGQDQDHGSWQKCCRVERDFSGEQSSQVCLGSLTVKLKSQNAVQHAGDQEGQPGGAEHVFDIVEDTGFCQLAD